MGSRVERWQRLLQKYLDEAVDEDADRLLEARVHLGTASWGERARYHLHLGPSAEMWKDCAQRRELRARLAELEALAAQR